MKSNRKAVWLGTLFIIAVAAAILFSTPRRGKFRCEICITFDGRSDCRTASADTQEQARRAATENVCAQLSSGVTASQQCEHTLPSRFRWLD